MNVLSSFVIPYCWVIESRSLYLEHSLATSPRLLMNGSFVSMPDMISCFCRTRSLMNETKRVTGRE